MVWHFQSYRLEMARACDVDGMQNSNDMSGRINKFLKPSYARVHVQSL